MRQDKVAQVRLAAMAGHIGIDKIAARRAVLVDLLADGRPHTREAIWAHAIQQLGADCWGKRRDEALWRDIDALRRGGIRIAYSRRSSAMGYYLQYPTLEATMPEKYEATSLLLVDRIRQLSVAEKNERTFAAADFALQQKRLLLTEQYPEWSSNTTDLEARRLVFGTDDTVLQK